MGDQHQLICAEISREHHLALRVVFATTLEHVEPAETAA